MVYNTKKAMYAFVERFLYMACREALYNVKYI